MQLPNITPIEVLVVVAGFLLLCVAPAALAWSEERRRRAHELAASAAPAFTSLEQTVSLDTVPDEPHDATEPALIVTEGLRVEAPLEPAPPIEESPITPPVPVVETPTRPAFEEVDESARHQFRLEELRRARLADWPPAAVRADADRHRLWQEAERLVAQHQAAISTVVLRSPYPAQSSCLGSVEADEARYYLHFLLFPTLWPVGADQAVAEAIFEIDRNGGALHHRVRARRASDLTDEQRRDIRQSGGHV